MITLFVILPLACAFLVVMLSKIKKLPDFIANICGISLLGLSIYLLDKIPIIYQVGGWKAVGKIPIAIYLVFDGLSSFMLLIVNLISAIILFYSIKYMQLYTSKSKFYCLFMLMLAGMNGVILSGDLFNLFVFMEIAAISSYALVSFGTGSEELEAGFKYQVMGSIASALILLGIALIYSFTGTLNLADIGNVLKQTGPNMLTLFVIALFLVGFGLKAGIVPFHAWLPDAHPSAPASVSGMLSGLLIKAIGIYPLIRISYSVFDLRNNLLFTNVLLWLGLITMTIPAFVALNQKDLKRMLAYSSISQIGYIVFALGIANPLAILGAVFHLFNHAVAKSLLFLNSGSIIYATSERNMSKLGGLKNKMPVTSGSSLIASLSIAGVPPVAGFWSKLLIILGAIKAGYYFAGFWAVIVSILTLAYYLRMQRLVFYGEEKIEAKESPPVMVFAMILLAIIALAGGFLLLPKFSFIMNHARDVILNGLISYKNIVLGG
jgi:multicomponent Na+:H+ antiporter subunit D